MDTYIHRLHLSIDHALAVSYRRNAYDGKTAFVAHITLVKGIPFYGYHVGYKIYLKVYMYNPLNMTRLADLLRQGAVMKKAIQPYESHMQYLLQWMCDYNLYGCAYIDCSAVKFRDPVPDYQEINNTVHQWHDRSIDPSLISDPDGLPRQSHCSLEVDICVQDISNRLEVKPRPLHHDFIERKNSIQPDEKLVHSMAGLWRDETRRRKATMAKLYPGDTPFSPDVLVSVSADPRHSQPGGWIHEEEYRSKIETIRDDEKNKSDGSKVAFGAFVRKTPFEARVQTALDSVSDLYPSNLSTALSSPKATQDIDGADEIEVDESRVLSYEQEDYSYDSDAELALDLEILHQKQAEKVEESPLKRATNDLPEDDCRPGSELDAESFKDPLDPVPSAETLGPTSSAELAALGIRDAGDYSHVQEDAFEIAPEYTSDISGAMKRHERAKKPASEPATKKRKLSRNGRSQSIEIFESRLKAEGAHGTQRSIPGDSLQPDEQLPSWDASGSKVAEIEREEGKPSTDQINPVILKRSSQDMLEINGANGNRTLAFPVVKDPQDPHTIQRLSQQSGSPTKSSQKSSSKRVLFDPSVKYSSQDSGQSFRTNSTSVTLSKVEVSNTLALSLTFRGTFDITAGTKVFCYGRDPPSVSEISQMMRYTKVPSVIYQDAFYGNEMDIPERAREYAGKDFKLESDTVPYLPDFDSTGLSPASFGEKPSVIVDKTGLEKLHQRRRRACNFRRWEIGEPPPTRLEVESWELIQPIDQDRPASTFIRAKANLTDQAELSQIDGATQKNRHGFKYSQKQDSTSVQHEIQYMSIMSLEIHVNTRDDLVPNPELDEIACVFWSLQGEDKNIEANCKGNRVGILALSERGGMAHKISQQCSVEVEEEETELDLINRMIDIVRNWDPDILTGYEVHGGSWGYMIERARCQYDYNLCDEFSRMKSQSYGRFGKESDKWGFEHTSTIRVTGRHMINIWRAMRGELNLLQYTMENVVFHILHRRVPHYAHRTLTTWYTNRNPRSLGRLVDYYVLRVQLDLEILEQNELIPRTSEQARLLGVDFFSVFSRGSQFKVESLMFRIAKPENFLLPSPSRKQVGQQNALECLPLVMEPQSAFYSSPLLVLDFQSLYPSVMIAYNYCYSTFLGRVVNWRGQNKMGFTDYKREQRLLELLKDHINIAPNGIMYAKPHIRKSLLAKMLGEILETRVMVKSGMKVDKDDKALQRLLNNRQLALKLIANVTYGYTSASFSGRMPCSEIADSIVQTGRETLEKAIALIHSVERWGAEVVYGDTDSLFVYLKGRTKDEAFDIGQEIASTVTKMNPRPVKLKFEKVYLPCVLLAKKRYVGFKYENKTQKEPDFDAKGIETVRRDGTPAEQKIEEQALKILFRTADLSQVKGYFQRQCMKIMKGKVSIQDFCFAKEVKLGTYSDKGPPPPGALISTRRMLEDPRAEPQYGERVPYVVITGAPGARLIDRCVAPDVLLHDHHVELDAEYYISKNLIPPLERIFNLTGANVRQWYDEMPKFQRIRRVEVGPLANRKEIILTKKTLESYMKPSSCLVCREKLEAEIPICSNCMQHTETSLLAMRFKLSKTENKAINLEKICRSCAGLAFGEEVKCDSKDCPVFYTRARHFAGLRSTKSVTEPVIQVLEDLEDGALEW